MANNKIIYAFIILILTLNLLGCDEGKTDNTSCVTCDSVPQGTAPLEPDSYPAFSYTEGASGGGGFVTIQYESIWDVHSPDNPARALNQNVPLRSQPGWLDNYKILNDLDDYIDAAKYDFVLFYSINELPGWIHSGGRCDYPAENIGFINSAVGINFCESSLPGWKRLRGFPHMNAVKNTQVENYPSGPYELLIPIHEISHYWGVYWTKKSQGPREWRPGDPLAWLAASSFHWNWTWYEEGLPGMLYSAPLSEQLNAFDLYGMGLMGYDEVKFYEYLLYDENSPSSLYSIGVDHLIDSLKIDGDEYASDDGTRIPDTDETVLDMNVLVVLVTGKGEYASNAEKSTLLHISDTLPQAWSTATWHRSILSTDIILKQVD